MSNIQLQSIQYQKQSRINWQFQIVKQTVKNYVVLKQYAKMVKYPIVELFLETTGYPWLTTITNGCKLVSTM